MGTLRFLQSVSGSRGVRGRRGAGPQRGPVPTTCGRRSRGSRESSQGRPAGRAEKRGDPGSPRAGLSLSWPARSPAPSRGLPHFVSPRARCPFVFFFFSLPRLSNSFKISYIREAGALRPKRLELWLLLVCRQGFLRRLCPAEPSARTAPWKGGSPASLRADGVGQSPEPAGWTAPTRPQRGTPGPHAHAFPGAWGQWGLELTTWQSKPSPPPPPSHL